MAIYIVEEHTFRLFLGSNNTRGIRIKLAAENEKKQKSIKKSINTHTHMFLEKLSRLYVNMSRMDVNMSRKDVNQSLRWRTFCTSTARPQKKAVNVSHRWGGLIGVASTKGPAGTAWNKGTSWFPSSGRRLIQGVGRTRGR